MSKLNNIGKFLLLSEEDTTQALNLLEMAKKKLECLAVQSKLDDGTIVSYDELKEGNDIQVIDEAGVVMPLGDNDYTLEDGTTITVKDGKIESLIIPTEEPATPESDTLPVEEIKAELPVVEPEVEANPLEERVAALEAKLDELIALITEATLMKAEFSKQLSEQDIKLNAIAEQPLSIATKDIKTTKINKPMTATQKLASSLNK